MKEIKKRMSKTHPTLIYQNSNLFFNSLFTQSASELGGLGVGNRRRRSKTGWADEPHAEAEGLRAFGRIIQQLNSRARGHYAVMTPEQRAGRWRAAGLTLHDGLTDGTEDPDANGLQTFGETDPNDPDTDGDGLADGWIDQQVWNSSSQQFEACADGTAGVFDAWEGEDSDKDGEVDMDANETMLETSAITRDSDGDGLWDGDEVKPEMISEDSIANPNEYVTDALKSDTDNDRISDYMEIVGWNMSTYWEASFEVRKDTYSVYSNPTDSDTDNDGLLDGDEYVYTSDPTDVDSDDDGINDKAEVNCGRKPGNKDGIAPEIYDIDCWVDPIVKTDNNGIKFLSGNKIKITTSTGDPSYVHYVELEINDKVVRRYLQNNLIKTNITNELINITTDYPFGEQDRLIIKVVDFCGNVKEIALIPNDYWPNFRGQNWVDPAVYFYLVTIKKGWTLDPGVVKELPRRFSTEYRGVIKRGIKSEYSQIKFVYNSLDYYILKDKINTKAYIDQIQIDSFNLAKYRGIFLYTLIRMFRSNDYKRLKDDVEKFTLSDSYYSIDFHLILDNLKNDFKTLDDTFKTNTVMKNKIKDFFTITVKNYINNNWGWYMDDRDTDNVPNIIKIGHGTYKLYSTTKYLTHHDMDQDGIKDYDELKVILRPSLDAYKDFKSGWIDIWIGGTINQMIRCEFVDIRNFYLTRNYEYDHRQLFRKGIVKDTTGIAYEYYLMRIKKYKDTPSEETIFTIYVVLRDNPNKPDGHYLTSFYKFNMKNKNNLDRDCKDLPNAMYYPIETKLCPGANPIILDLFVEIDWMWFGDKYYWWNNKIIWYDKDSFNKDDNHKMTATAINKVKEVFKKHGINVHIDTGSLGDGRPIPHVYYLYTEIDRNENDLYDYYSNSGYFNIIRRGIYHYSIFCHYGYDKDKNTKDFEGSGEEPGDVFQICDEQLTPGIDSDVNYISHDRKQTSTFMHELGHNLGLKHRGKKETAMFTSDKGGGKAYWAENYLSEEWSSLNLVNSFS
jgi:hypothetical protein